MDKFDVLHHHVTSLVCMSVVKISDKFIRPTTVICGTDLLYQTQHEIQITAGSESVNESLIDTVGCLTSVLFGQGINVKLEHNI